MGKSFMAEISDALKADGDNEHRAKINQHPSARGLGLPADDRWEILTELASKTETNSAVFSALTNCRRLRRSAPRRQRALVRAMLTSARKKTTWF
jgi:hypothetical protein